MKNLFIILFFLPIGLMAQNKTSFGVKAGVNFGSSSDANSEVMPGFFGGGFVNYKLNKVFSLQTELLYTNYKYDIRGTVTDQFGKSFPNYSHYAFSKIELPLLIKASAKLGVVKPFASFGISPGINLNGNFKQDATNLAPEVSRNITAHTNKFSLAIIPSIGFSVKDRIIFDARYAFGITNQYDFTNTKTGIFYLTLGYKF